MAVNMARSRAAKAGRRKAVVEAKRKAEKAGKGKVADWAFCGLGTELPKASAALMELVEPWRDGCEDRDSYYKILMLGMTAWNISFMPADERKEHVRSILETVIEGDNDGGTGRSSAIEEDCADFEAILAELVSRKLLLFPLDRRFLLNLNLVETSGDYRVTVMSELKKAA
jgi:hypothetical protein